jgi:hypothetical protein
MARCGGKEDQRTHILYGLASEDAAASPRRDVEKITVLWRDSVVRFAGAFF